MVVVSAAHRFSVCLDSGWAERKKKRGRRRLGAWGAWAYRREASESRVGTRWSFAGNWIVTERPLYSQALGSPGDRVPHAELGGGRLQWAGWMTPNAKFQRGAPSAPN